MSMLLFLFYSCCPRGRAGCVPRCVSGSDGWESSLVLGAFTLVLLHPGSSAGMWNQTCIKKIYQKVKKGWFLLLTWFPRQAKTPVPVKWWFFVDEGGSAETPWQGLAIGAQYIILSYCHSTREEIIFFSSGELRGSSEFNWKKIPPFFLFPTPYTVIKHLLYMNSLHASCEGTNTKEMDKTEVEKKSM